MRGTDVTMHTALIALWLTVFLVGAVLPAAVLPAEEPAKNVFGRCILPLGMEEGKIPDDAITASSSYETKSVGPQNARIRQEKNGGAWCPKAQISSAIREFLEVDLTREHLIAWTETQGRFGNGQGQEYAEAFFLEYWRDGGWHQYKNLRGERVLRGNSNTYLVEKQRLDLPFVASRVRFVPYSQHPRTVCMRVEIYGCVWEQHVARYGAPRGSSVGPSGLNVEDSSYDGTQAEGTMRKGLGQLTDGILGEDSEILTGSGSGSGTNWIGWSTRDRNVVELLFEFDELREFENCSIHVAAIPERGIEIFSTARVWFSVNGETYRSDPETLEIPRPVPSPGTGVVSIPLRSRLGRSLKLELELRSEWLLVSELTFETHPASLANLSNGASNPPSDRYHRQFPNETVGVAPSSPSSSSTPSTPSTPSTLPSMATPAPPPRYELAEGSWLDGSDGSDGSVGGSNETANEEDSTPDAFPVGSSQTYVGLVSGLLTILALLFTCTTFLMKQRGRNKVALLQKHTALLCGANATGITVNVKDVILPNPVHVNGSSSHSRLSIKSKPDGYVRPVVLPEPELEPELERSTTAYERTYKLFCEDNAEYSDPRATTEKSYAQAEPPTPMSTPYPARKSNGLKRSVPTAGRAKQKVHEGYYAATDILTIKKRESGTTLSLFTPLRINDEDSRPRYAGSGLDDREYDVQRVSRHRLRILDKLGEGSFGLVHLCEAKGIQSPELGTLRNRQIVIVRSLWRGVVDSLRKDFTRDMYALSRLRDPNLARIIALVEEEPFGAVFEYGELGELPSFMERTEKGKENGTTLCLEHRLNFFAQIASGLKYLESLNIAHCDVAARNCIVGKNFAIKVSDHAMYLGKYDRHYYVDASYAKIPLRWMSWESALLGKRTCRADVWSYAITIWEILTNCEDLPYSELTSEQVLENCSRWYNGGASQTERTSQPRVLPRPTSCPDDLYATMIDCWSKQPEDRPTFREIYLYFERLGYA